LYGAASEPYFTGLEAVHVVAGRKESGTGEPQRVARMRSHSHELLGHELNRLMRVHRPDLVQVEHVELALLARWKRGQTPWILTLHDVLLSGGPTPSAADCFERYWIGKFDHLIACCEEDASLLHALRVSVVGNGAALESDGYTPSTGLSDLLFLGPFRYAPNWQGIEEFLSQAYPALQAHLPRVRLHILGGVDARTRANTCDRFRQPGVHVYDHVDDVAPWLRACALTINPIRHNRGSCLKVIQSLAAGRVCVSTREGARGFLGSELRGLIAVETVSEFTEAIERLLIDEETRLKLEAPEPSKLEPYRWERSAEQQMAIYRCLLKARSVHNG